MICNLVGMDFVFIMLLNVDKQQFFYYVGCCFFYFLLFGMYINLLYVYFFKIMDFLEKYGEFYDLIVVYGEFEFIFEVIVVILFLYVIDVY